MDGAIHYEYLMRFEPLLTGDGGTRLNLKLYFIYSCSFETFEMG